jgi:hypothetical protein
MFAGCAASSRGSIYMPLPCSAKTGGVIGLLVLTQLPDRFARLMAMNTDIPDGRDLGEAFMRWRRFAQRQRALDASHS